MGALYENVEIYDLAHTPKMEEAMKEQWKKLFYGKSIHTILDCSIGTGNLTLSLAEIGYELSGSDLSDKMLERCQIKAQERGLKVNLKRCDFRNLTDVFHTKFDCVMSTGHSLPYVTNEDVKRTIAQMDILGRNSGYIYLDNRNWDKILKTKQRFYFYPPFFNNDTRINLMQVWDYNSDSTVTFNLLYTFERNNQILQKEIFEEKYYPLKKQTLVDELIRIEYNIEKIALFPYINELSVDETDWFCILAKKNA